MVVADPRTEHGGMDVIVILLAMLVLPVAAAIAAALKAEQAAGTRQVALWVLTAVLGVLAVLCAGAAWWLWRFSQDFTF